MIKNGIINADDLLAKGITSADDLSKLGFSSVDDLVKLNIIGEEELEKLGLNSVEELKKIGVTSGDDFARIGFKGCSEINKTRVQNILDTMPELTGTTREKLLSAIQNQKLSKIANELYRKGAIIGDGGTAAVLVDEFSKGSTKHLKKACERVKQLKKIINSNELGLNDLDIAEALVTDLEEAINLFE
ncbi:hypothetical protein ACTNDG_11060 [Clostridium sp. HCP1S3_B4]|uniref:hypothetical protein n=1 Tax=unclassified Clostridium TaxID=2614128 RepID=UPI003F88E0EF